MMDIVITYVDGLDPLWQEDYNRYAGQPINVKRFRDWGTLKYLFRGIETNMPFIRKVFLVVARESQVPGWVDRTTVDVVLHEDFIPKDFLPVFNCNPLEVYLHRINGLGERFLYFNDDMFPMMPCREEDFFIDGKAVMHTARQFFTFGMYRKICSNSYSLARKASGRDGMSLTYLRPQHTCAPMFRSVSEEVFSRVRTEADATASRKLRSAKDVNQYLYTDYQVLEGMTVHRRLSNKHFSLASSSMDAICAFIEHPDRKMACINDVNFPDERFNEMKERMLGSFERRFPNKSKYEL